VELNEVNRLDNSDDNPKEYRDEATQLIIEEIPANFLPILAVVSCIVCVLLAVGSVVIADCWLVTQRIVRRIVQGTTTDL